jgi:putative membrane protein
MAEPIPFRRNRPLQWMIAWLAGLWLVTAIAPFNRFDWLLENLLVFIYGILLLATYRRFAFSNTS